MSDFEDFAGMRRVTATQLMALSPSLLQLASSPLTSTSIHHRSRAGPTGDAIFVRRAGVAPISMKSPWSFTI